MARPRHITLAVLAAAVLLPAAPAAAKPSCAKLPASATRSTTDPVAFQDNGRVTVHAFHSLTAVQVRIVKAGKVLARGAVARIRPGAAAVPV
ncbi:MAG: hypothetical protein JWM71_545, partial [Solirubrobacteraceae bacterium]|nr:hypothetical protein [Solirubrobacteraceae bacterium]